MRKEKWVKGNIVHTVRRGSRGMPFIRGDADRWRYLKTLYYLNDEHAHNTTLRDIDLMLTVGTIKLFEWPKNWPVRRPLVSIAAFTLLDNHDHNLHSEIVEKGISAFMQKSGVSRARYYNERYKETGGIFQGPYQARVVDSDKYLRWVAAYVMCKNTFEMHPKGYTWCAKNFDVAWEWAIQYPFSSLGDYGGTRKSPIVDTKLLKEMVGGPKEFNDICRDMIIGRKSKASGIDIGDVDYIKRLSLEE